MDEQSLLKSLEEKVTILQCHQCLWDFSNGYHGKPRHIVPELAEIEHILKTIDFLELDIDRYNGVNPLQFIKVLKGVKPCDYKEVLDRSFLKKKGKLSSANLITALTILKLFLSCYGELVDLGLVDNPADSLADISEQLYEYFLDDPDNSAKTKSFDCVLISIWNESKGEGAESDKPIIHF